MQWNKKNNPTIKQFQQLIILEKEGELDGFDRELRFAAIMRGLSNKEAEETLELKDIMETNSKFQMPNQGKPIYTYPKRVWIKRRCFQIMPDYTRLKFGEFTAFEHFTRTPNTSVREMHNILALLTREVKFPYLWSQPRKEPPEVWLERANFLQDHAPSSLALSVSGFFLQLWDECCALTLQTQKMPPTKVDRWRIARRHHRKQS